MFFVNELWFFSIRPFSNGPFWSIGYEFWYYVLFALGYYLSIPIKYFLIAITSLVIGPKILILFPTWLAGVAVYKITSSSKTPEWLGWIFISVSTMGYLLFRLNGGHELLIEYTKTLIGDKTYESLLWSRYFASSYIIAVFVSLNFIGFSAISHRLEKALNYFELPIRYLASYTFILYLAHYPLLQFFSALSYNEITERTQPLLVVTGTLASVWLLGFVTEKQKNNYKRIFYGLWLKLGKPLI